jgi:hypothetical protein
LPPAVTCVDALTRCEVDDRRAPTGGTDASGRVIDVRPNASLGRWCGQSWVGSWTPWGSGLS